MPKQEVDRHPDRADVSTVISVLPVPIDDSKPGLIPTQYALAPVKDPMKDFSYLHVFRARFPVYLDENRPALVVPAPSDTVAESICRDYKVSMSYVEAGVAEPGIFWVRGLYKEKDIQSELAEELHEARKKQLVWFERLVEIADDDWNRYHIRRMITTIQKLAASTLKLDREWSLDKDIRNALAVTNCKFCRAEIHPDAVVCRYCSGVLDVKKATEAGFIKADDFK